MSCQSLLSRIRIGVLAAAGSALLLVGVASSARGSEARVVRLGPAPAGVALQIVLPLQVDAAGLRRLALAVSDPGSSLYGHYQTVAAVADRYGASLSTRWRVLRYLRSRGARDVKIDATGLLAEATVTAGLAERLFATRLVRFHGHGLAEHAFIAPAGGVSLPPGLRGLVDGVVGLATRQVAAPGRLLRARFGAIRRSPGAASAATQPPSNLPRSGTPAGCAAGVSAGEVNGSPATAGFTPNQYRTAYGFDPLLGAGLAGQGERVALIEIDGYRQADLAAFAQCFGLNLPSITPYGVGVSRPLPPGGEATLDLEVLDAAAPSLKGIDVYETHSDPADLLKALVAPLQVRGHKPQVVSASLGLCEQEQLGAIGGAVGFAAAERTLEMATAAGVSFVAASGDNGSADCTRSDGGPLYELAVNYPASSPWVTGVGGTNLQLNPANQITTQIVWNDTSNQVAAGGGGLSAFIRRPAYQRGFVRAGERAVPDVSMLADLAPGYAIYCTASPECSNAGNPWQAVGGTSAATPLLAGGLALIDQSLRVRGRADVGFVNPLLYMLGGSRARASVFSDVTAIGNDVGPFLPTGGGRPLGCCAAKPGYDLASGWGSVEIANFAQRAATLVPYILGRLRLSIPARQRPVANDAILATVSCSRACYMAAYADLRFGRRSFTVDSSIFDRPSGASKTLALVFSAAQRRALSAALARHTPVLATVYGVIVDPQGFIQRRTAGRRLVIRG